MLERLAIQHERLLLVRPRSYCHRRCRRISRAVVRDGALGLLETTLLEAVVPPSTHRQLSDGRSKPRPPEKLSSPPIRVRPRNPHKTKRKLAEKSLPVNSTQFDKIEL